MAYRASEPAPRLPQAIHALRDFGLLNACVFNGERTQLETTTYSPDRGHAESRRLESIQVLRGVAAMLVVFNHAGLLAVSMDNRFGPSWLVPSEAVADMGAIGVDLFFVISGFVMSLSARRFMGPWGASTFMALRFVRIAPLFYLASILMLANLVRAGLPVDPSSLLNSITFIPVFDDETYSWPLHYLGRTLSFEFAFYFLVGILIAAGAGTNPAMLLAITVAVPFLGFMLQAQSAAWKVFTNPILWEFALSVVAYILWKRCLLRRLRAPFAILAVAAFLAITLAIWLGRDWLAATGWDGPIGAASSGIGTL